MSPPSATDLQRRIVECVTYARGVDVRQFELGSSEEVAEGLVPEVVQGLQCAIRICLDALDAYDEEDSASDDPFDGDGRSSSVFAVDVDAILGREESERQVADVAFLGVTELRPKLQRIERLPPGVDRWDAVAECGSSLRRIAKSLTALELALCRLEHVEPALSFASQLTRSLEVRRQYARLRRAIVDKAPTAATLVAAMRSAGTAIAVLIGKDIYPDLRIHDRRQIRELQARILTWLRVENGEDEHVREGMRIWQDLLGFAGLIVHVSRRQELVEHDAIVVGRAHDVMRGLASGALGDELVALLDTLTGLDPELDALLVRHERDAGAWRPVIERLHSERSSNHASPPSFDISTDAGDDAQRGAAR